MKKSTKALKAVTISNKILDILEVVITPIHEKATREQVISKNEISEVFTVAKLVKDIAQFADTEDEFEDLTDEEIQAQLEEYRKQQSNDDDEGEEE